MSHIDKAADYIANVIGESYGTELGAVEVTDMLVDLIHFCGRTRGVSFERCLLAARAQAQKEVREAADATPLPAK